MKRVYLFSLIFIAITGAAVIGVNHYLFLKRLSRTDAKYFHHHIYALTTAKTAVERVAAVRRVHAGPEFRDFDVALVSNHVLLLRAHTLVVDAYILAYPIGTGEAWAIGWLHRGRFSRMGTYTPPTNPGGS